MPQARKPLRRVRPRRNSSSRPLALNLTDEAREVIAHYERTNAALAALDAAAQKKDSRKAWAECNASSADLREVYMAHVDGVVSRIAGNWLRDKEKRVENLDDLATLGVIAYLGWNRDGTAWHALVREMVNAAGIFPCKRNGYSMRPQRK